MLSGIRPTSKRFRRVAPRSSRCESPGGQTIPKRNEILGLAASDPQVEATLAQVLQTQRCPSDVQERPRRMLSVTAIPMGSSVRRLSHEQAQNGSNNPSGSGTSSAKRRRIWGVHSLPKSTAARRLPERRCPFAHGGVSASVVSSGICPSVARRCCRLGRPIGVAFEFSRGDLLAYGLDGALANAVRPVRRQRRVGLTSALAHGACGTCVASRGHVSFSSVARAPRWCSDSRCDR